MNKIDIDISLWFLKIFGSPDSVPGFVLFLFRPFQGLQLNIVDILIIGLLFAIFFWYFDEIPGWKTNRRTIKKMIVIGFTGLISFLFSFLLKIIFLRPRPFISEEVIPWFRVGHLDSFPSGHSVFFMSLAVATFFYYKKLGIFYIAVALIIGLTRIISGVHYFSDVLVGVLLGALIAIVFHKILNKYYNYYINS